MILRLMVLICIGLRSNEPLVLRDMVPYLSSLHFEDGADHQLRYAVRCARR